MDSGKEEIPKDDGSDGEITRGSKTAGEETILMKQVITQAENTMKKIMETIMSQTEDIWNTFQSVITKIRRETD